MIIRSIQVLTTQNTLLAICFPYGMICMVLLKIFFSGSIPMSCCRKNDIYLPFFCYRIENGKLKQNGQNLEYFCALNCEILTIFNRVKIISQSPFVLVSCVNLAQFEQKLTEPFTNIHTYIQTYIHTTFREL